VRYYAAVLAVVLVVALVAPAQAAEASAKPSKTKCKTIIVNAGDDENLVTLSEGDGGKLITINEDGKKRIIKLKDGKLLDFDDKLDTDTHIKLLDAKIAYIKATGQLKADLAVKRVEAEKLGLAKKPDAEITAKKKEINALKARLADAKLDYEQKVKKLVPEDMVDMYMLGLGGESGLLELNLGLGSEMSKRIIKRIELIDDGDEEEGD
jgi:hypothetical protein